MKGETIRFSVTDNRLRAATWILWTQKSKWGKEIYLSCRELRGVIHTSFHPTGEWHTTFSREMIEGKTGKYIQEWMAPREVMMGVVLAYKIVTPWSAVTIPITKNMTNIIQLEKALQGKANETMILIADRRETSSSFGKIIGTLDLSENKQVVVINHEINMPTIINLPKRIPVQCFKGKSEKDLKHNGLRTILFSDNLDGCRMVIDCPIRTKKK